MKKRILLLLAMLLLSLPLTASAGLDLSSFDVFKAQATGQNQKHFPETSYAKWENRSGNQLAFSCELYNDGDDETVAYELHVYTEDVWGNRLLPEDEVYAYTLKKAIEPEHVRYSGYMLIPDRSEIYKVYVAIKKVRFANDRIITFDNPEYYNWTID